jgi:GNAT superfamily N-acetyltransferase
MEAVEYQLGGYAISTDPTRLDVGVIHDFLSRRSYWAQGRSPAVVQKTIEHSLCFGVFSAAEQVGFARVVTDYATFAWLCDVFIVEAHRGRGLSKWLIECVVAHPELQSLKRILLATRDAHELYRRYGRFETLSEPETWMVRLPNKELILP